MCLQLLNVEMCSVLQRDLEKLSADLQTKDRELRTVTKERDQFQGTARVGENAVKAHQVYLCVSCVCVYAIYACLHACYMYDFQDLVACEGRVKSFRCAITLQCSYSQFQSGCPNSKCYVV